MILPLSRQSSFTRHGTRHLAALGLTERHDRCLCVVVSEESGTISMASQGRFERPITRERLRELLSEAVSRRQARTLPKPSLSGDRSDSTSRVRS